ncbi:hypothetical protein AAFF_G00304360 [Aldrovandia affinis]|uniref:Uncharacterized protein n=1 Tax=Aldrovandia affinis TaxID=143900 RepID=A0AAD7SP69_9TELE|nr:hypothetical protein AAFF_G00304360 [Aldrovandia affinis]
MSSAFRRAPRRSINTHVTPPDPDRRSDISQRRAESKRRTAARREKGRRLKIAASETRRGVTGQSAHDAAATTHVDRGPRE